MTLVAGFCCHEGLVILSDMEESVGLTGKRAANKMKEVIFACHVPEWRGTFTGAGDAATIDIAIDIFSQKLTQMKSFYIDHIRSVLTEVLGECHDKYIDPVPGCSINLICGMVCAGQSLLISSTRRTPQIHNNFIAHGYGEEMATYFSDRLHDYWHSLADTAKLACFISREVNQTAQYCGLGAEMVLLRKDGGWKKIGASGMEQLLSELPDFDVTLTEYGEKLKAAKPPMLYETQ